MRRNDLLFRVHVDASATIQGVGDFPGLELVVVRSAKEGVSNFAVIRWVFEIRDKGGKTLRFEELAHQRWEGDLMAEERFFYDPAQLKSPIA